MSFSDFMDSRTTSREDLQHRALSMPWYKAGFEHGINVAVTIMGKALDLQPDTIQVIKDELAQNMDHFMVRALDGAYDEKRRT